MRRVNFFLMMITLVAFIACSEDEDSDSFCENPEAVCPDNSEIEASACCSSSSCYWTYKGVDKPCDGTNCNEVRKEIIADACVAGVDLKSWDGDLIELDAQLEALTEKLLAEARDCAACE